MDYLTRVSLDHGNIFESLTLFKTLIETGQSEGGDYNEKVLEFFDNLLTPHFQYEEGNVFPIMLKYGTPQEKDLTDQLIGEHKSIRALIAEYRPFLLQNVTDHRNNTAISGLRDNIFKNLLEHGRKEDTSFYPNIKKYLLK